MTLDRRSFTGGAVATTLASDINNSTVTIPLATGGGATYPTGSSGNYFIVIDRTLSSEEKVRITSRSSDTLTAVASTGRGSDSTSAVTHSAGATVELCVTAVDLDEANNAVAQTIGAITTKGDLIAASAANAFVRVAAGSNNQLLIADSTQTSGIKWGALPDGAVTTAAKIVSGIITDTQVAAANKDGIAAAASLRTLGTGSTQATAGNDARLSDTRTPTDGSITTLAKFAAPTLPIFVCTSSTRPTAVEGQQIYETDTDRIYAYNGSAWILVHANVKPSVRAYRSTDQVLSTGASTAITLDSERYDTDSFHSTSANTSRFTVPTGLAGVYTIKAGIEWQASSAGQRVITIKLNGTTEIMDVGGPNNGAGATTRQTIATDYKLAAADYIEVIGFQDAGGNLSVKSTGNYSPEFMMIWQGPY